MGSIDHRTGHSSLPDNTPLIRAMHACGNAYCEENRQHLYRMLLESTLLVPYSRHPEAAPDAPENRRDGFLLAPHPGTGEPAIMAFTDPGTMALYHLEEAEYRVVPAAEIFQRLSPAGAPALIVCVEDSHLPISHAEIEKLAAGLIPSPQVMATAAPTSGAAPITFRELDRELPRSLLQTLHDLLEPSTEVSAVYVFLSRKDDGTPGFAAAVIFSAFPDEPTMRAIVDEIARIITPQLPVEESLTVFPLEKQDEFAGNIMQVLTPCYQRQLN